VKQICEEYELPYNSGPFAQQLGMVQRTILRLAFPGGSQRPKPGPYRPGAGEATASPDGNGAAPSAAKGGSGKSGPEQADPGVRVSIPEREA
jgi:linoleoyl-CoA desaturase